MKLETKQWKKLALIAFLLNILLFASLSYVLAPSGTTFTLSSGSYPLADYTVWREGSTYYAKDRVGAQPSFSASTNASYVISNALGDLDSGRTYKQKAVLTGSFTLTNQILVPSYTVLELRGALTLSSNVDAHMIVNDNANGNTQIEIVGGLLDGNRANQGNDYKGIELTNVTDALINGVSVTEFGTTGIDLVQCSNYDILNNFLNYTGGIGVRNSTNDGDITGNRIYNTELESGGDAHGINVQGGSGRCYEAFVTRNLVNKTSGMGISVDWASYDTTVSTNIVINTAGHAIEVGRGSWNVGTNIVVNNNKVKLAGQNGAGGSGIFIEADNCVVSGNLINQSKWDGIRAENITGLSLTGNTIDLSSSRGLFLISVFNSTISGNTILRSSQVGNYDGITLANSTSNTLTGNTITGTSGSAWGFDEEGSSDFNILGLSNIEGSSGGANGIRMAVAEGSALSRIVGCYNGTTWVATWGSG